LHSHAHLSKEGFEEVLNPAPSSPGPVGHETLKAFLKTVYKTKDIQQVA